MAWTAEDEEGLRPHVRPQFLAQWDQDFYNAYGRWPAGSSQTGRPANSARREKVANLARNAGTEGERLAAEAALARIDFEAEHHRATMDRLDLEAHDDSEGEAW